MIGAIVGDIVGSVFEFNNHRDKRFVLFAPDATFTDDTVLTVALAESLLDGGDYAQAMKRWYWRYSGVSYGERFRGWAQADEMQPYHSWAMARRCA